MRVQLGADKLKRKAVKSLEVKKRLSVSAPPTIGENGVERLSVTSNRSIFQTMAAAQHSLKYSAYRLRKGRRHVCDCSALKVI
jgi:hypothetical protein